MTPAEWARAREVFGDALDLDPAARESFVRQACAAEPALLERVLQMLKTEAQLGGFLEDPPPALAAAPALEFDGTARFTVRRFLGSGGFGSVYEAYDRERDMVVALKTLTRPDATNLLLFKREFRTLASLTHPNLVQLYELLNEGRFWFFTMELIPGTDLVSWVRQPALDLDRLRSALGSLVEAVAWVHGQGKLHLDIKPSNIRVTPEGIVKLLDFGMVRDVSPEPGYHTQAVGGTAAYMAPEQALTAPLTAACDWYSVGAVLFEALTGRAPFEGSFLEVLWAKRQSPAPPPRALAPGIPEDLNELCVSLLERDPGARRVPIVSPAPAAPPHAPAAIPLFGRSHHLAVLHRALEEARSGATVRVHVHGESGMGKTELCRRFLAEAAKDAQVLVLNGRCYLGESVPFKAIDPIVDALGRHLKRLPPQEAAAFLPRARPLLALARVFPTLRQAGSIASIRAEPLDSASPQDLRRLAIAALKEILARLAERAPLIVSIDDLQWGDLDSVECLTGILDEPDPPRALFLFSYRSEDAGSAPHLRQLRAHPSRAVDLPVSRLNAQESCALFHALTGRHDTGVDLETDGMPLFIRELAMHSPGAGLSLQQRIENRIRSLPESARRMMQVLSIAAQPIETALLRAAARLEEGEYPARAALLAANLVRVRHRQDREVLEPYHDKIREAAAALLEPADRRLHFERLASALESRDDADPEVLHSYFLAAGNLERARTFLEAAAERAERALAFDLAVRLRERRLEMCPPASPERWRLQESLGDALSSAGHGARAAQIYQDAAGGAGSDHLELVRKAGEQYVRSGHFEQGQALLLGLLQKTGFKPPTGRAGALASLLARRAWLRVRGLGYAVRPAGDVDPRAAGELDVCRVAALAMALHDPIRAAELQTRHLLSSLKLGEPYRIANSLAMEAGFLAAKGGAASYGRACRLLDKVDALASQSGHPNGASLGLSVRCKVAWFAGQWQESIRCGEKVNRLATEQLTRVAWEVYPTAVFWICSLACMGRWREAIDRLPRLIADGQARGDLLEVANLPVATFGYVRWLIADKPESAVQELESARQRLDEPGFVPQRFGVWYGLADVALYQGEAEAAWNHVTEGWLRLQASLILRIQTVRILMLHLRARAALAMAASLAPSPRHEWFVSEAARVATRIRRERTGWGDALAGFIDASAAMARGHEVAVPLMRAAEQDLARAGMRHYAAAARYRTDGRWDPWFEAQGFLRPEAVLRMLSPGIWP